MNDAPDRAAEGVAGDMPSPPTPPRASEVWRACLAEAVLAGGAVPWLGPAAVDHLGDPDGERVDLLAGRPVLIPRLALGHLRLTGADRLAFVQGLVSHDVAGLPEGGAVDALLLDHKGQPQAGLSVVRRPDDLFVAVDDGAGEVVRRTFVEHVIFDQVVVQALDERLATVTVVVAADEAGALAVAAPDPAVRSLLRARPFGPGWAVDVHLLAEDLARAWPAWSATGLRPVGERAWTAGRVAYGVASARGEGRLGLPQETGLDDRVSYRKGCYLGQEIMARVEARGRLRRGLRPLRLAGPPPGLGSAAGWRLEDAAGRALGALGSAAPAADGDGWWALAVLRLDAEDAGGWRVVVDGPPPRFGPAETTATLRPAPAGW